MLAWIRSRGRKSAVRGLDGALRINHDNEMRREVIKKKACISECMRFMWCFPGKCGGCYLGFL